MFRGGCVVYVRAQRGLLPPRASDMLALRIRAVDGKGLSPSRLQPCRPLPGLLTSTELKEYRSLLESIPRSCHDPKVLGRDDAEVVGNRIAEVRPIARNLFAQEIERRVGEVRTSCVAFVVCNVSMHQAP